MNIGPLRDDQLWIAVPCGESVQFCLDLDPTRPIGPSSSFGSTCKETDQRWSPKNVMSSAVRFMRSDGKKA
ncbi:MAG: hypothetical protein CL912_22925 [Deltaproteobacteria bacterium]|nr:hypothetical protein [Deltaproteobacteria bacterium]